MLVYGVCFEWWWLCSCGIGCVVIRNYVYCGMGVVHSRVAVELQYTVCTVLGRVYRIYNNKTFDFGGTKS